MVTTLTNTIRKVASIALILSLVTLVDGALVDCYQAFAASPVIGIGGTCDAIANCPAVDTANTYTALQTYTANVAVSSTQSTITMTTANYGSAIITAYSYYGSSELDLSDGAGGVNAAIARSGNAGNVFTDAVAYDTDVAGFSAGTRLLLGESGSASTLQVTVGNANVTGTISFNGSSTFSQAATQPSGACSKLGWVFSNDGHITFCNGTTYTSKV